MEKELGREFTNKEIVHHINGDILDNRPENLMILLRGQHNLIHGLTKLTEQQVREIRVSKDSRAELAKRCNVTVPTIRNAQIRKTWKWVI